MVTLDSFSGNTFRFGEGVQATFNGEIVEVIGVTDIASSQVGADLAIRFGQTDFVVPRSEVKVDDKSSRKRLLQHIKRAGNTLRLPVLPVHSAKQPVAS